jgi:glycosyltransferase involved in cell wall biosynthesis
MKRLVFRRRGRGLCCPWAHAPAVASLAPAAQMLGPSAHGRHKCYARMCFVLTVAEAMWQARPVVARAVGGIQDRIESEADGLLLQGPADLPAFADAIDRLLVDHRLAAPLLFSG